MRLNADLEPGRSLVSHPRRKAGKGAVKLLHNEKRGAASLKPPPNAYRLAEARMKSVGDACFSLLFAGSMLLFRAKAAPLADCQSDDRSESPLFVSGNGCRTGGGPTRRWQSTQIKAERT